MTGQKLKAFVRRKLQLQYHDIRCDPVHFLYTARQFADIELIDATYLARLDNEIRKRPGLAEKSQSCLLFELGQDIRLGIAVVNTAFEDSALACATGPVAASVWQSDASLQRRGKHGLAVAARESMVAGFDRYLTRHDVDTLPKPIRVRVKMNA